MKNKVVRTVLCALLSAVIVLSLPLSSVCAAKADYPVVYVAGVEESNIYKNPNKKDAAVKFGVNNTSFISSCTSMAASLVINEAGAAGVVTRELNKIFADIRCSENGSSADANTGTYNFNMPLSYYEGEEIDTATLRSVIAASNGKYTADDIYVFTCDWRLSPVDTSAKLKAYIDSVLAFADADKVTLLCGGFGGTVGAAYLSEHRSHAAKNVDSVTFMNCPLWGNANIGDLMSGQIYQTAGDAHSLLDLIDKVDGKSRGAAFFSYFNQDPDGFFSNIMESFLGQGAFSSLVQMLIKTIVIGTAGAESLDRKMGQSYIDFLLKNEKALYENVLREALRTMPGVWAMVPEEYFDDAVDYMFGSEEINSTLYDKIMHYRKSIMNNIDSVLSNAKTLGIKTYVVVNYGVQNIPLTCSLEASSDSMLTARHASAGAVTLECSDKWEGYNHCINSYHNHKDPNVEIDASTCALPENTWFIKSLPHMNFSCPTAAAFLVWLMTSTKQMTVWDNDFYTQYMRYNKYANAISAFTDSTADIDVYTYGDYNFDGKVTIDDARTILRVAIGLEQKPSRYTLVVGDVGGDGYIGVDDARLVLRYAIGLDRSFPVSD